MSAVPCRPNCQLACPVDSWSAHVLDDTHPHAPSWRLGHAISWGWIPADRWPDALATFEAVYGRLELLDALDYLATDAPRTQTFTFQHQQRIAAIHDAYVRQKDAA